MTASFLDLSTWSTELELLVGLTRDKSDPDLASVKLATPGLGNVDWRRFIGLAQYHRVEGLVAANLIANRPAGVPDFVFDHFRDRLTQLSLSSLTTAKATIDISRALAQAGIRSLVLKGHAISERYYAQPNTRQAVDIDILVDPEMIGAARSVIEGLGFQQSSPSFRLRPSAETALLYLASNISFRRSSDATCVELHWRLDPNQRLLDWRLGTVTDSLTSLRMGGEDVIVLDTPAQLTYLCCHGAKHEWFRLKWLADIHRMLRILSAAELHRAERQARNCGVMRMVSAGLTFTNTLYGEPHARLSLSEEELEKSRSMQRYIFNSLVRCRDSDGVRFKDLPRQFASFRYRLRLRPDLRYKASTVFRSLCDTRDIEKIQLSARWLWLYAVLGPWLSAVRVLRNELRSFLQT